MASVILSEPQLDAFLAKYPALNRTQVLHAIVLHGPDRSRVETELQRLMGRVQHDAAKDD
jgi:hypothetical protein